MNKERIDKWKSSCYKEGLSIHAIVESGHILMLEMLEEIERLKKDSFKPEKNDRIECIGVSMKPGIIDPLLNPPLPPIFK